MTARRAYNVVAQALCRLRREPLEQCPCQRGQPCTAEKSLGMDAGFVVAALSRNDLLKDNGAPRALEGPRAALRAMAEVGEPLI